MTELTPSGAASLAISTIRQQLENALATIDNQAAFVAESINAYQSTSESEYNDAIDKLEAQYEFTDKKKREIDLLRLEVHSLKEKQTELESLSLDAQTKSSKAEVRALSEKSRADQAERELKRLRELNPDRLAKSNKEKTKLLDGQRKALTELRTSNLSLKRNDSLNQRKIEELAKVIGDADAEIQELRRQDKYRAMYNLHLKKQFFAEDDTEKKVPYFAYVLPYGLESLDEQLLDLEWKIFVMSATGEGVAVLMSEWLCPVFPPCSFARGVPKELVDAIMYFAIDALAETHGHLIDRSAWSQSVSVRDVLAPKQAEMLEANGVTTLHDVMMHQAFKLSKLKGIGDKSALAIMESANKYVTENYCAKELEAD